RPTPHRSLVVGRLPQAATGCLRGRPRGRLRAMITPRWKISPPQTPHGSPRSSAPARHASRTGQPAHSRLARSRYAGASANHRSGSPAWQGKLRSALSGSAGDTIAASGAKAVAVDISSPLEFVFISWCGERSADHTAQRPRIRRWVPRPLSESELSQRLHSKTRQRNWYLRSGRRRLGDDSGIKANWIRCHEANIAHRKCALPCAGHTKTPKQLVAAGTGEREDLHRCHLLCCLCRK